MISCVFLQNKYLLKQERNELTLKNDILQIKFDNQFDSQLKTKFKLANKSIITYKHKLANKLNKSRAARYLNSINKKMNPQRIMNQSYTDHSNSSHDNSNESQTSDDITNIYEKFSMQYGSDEKARKEFFIGKLDKLKQKAGKLTKQIKEECLDISNQQKAQNAHGKCRLQLQVEEEYWAQYRRVTGQSQKIYEQLIKRQRNNTEQKLQFPQKTQEQQKRQKKIQQANKQLEMSQIAEVNVEDEMSEIIQKEEKTGKQLVDLYSNTLQKVEELAQKVQIQKAEVMLDQQYKYLQKRGEEKIDQCLNQKVQEMKRKIDQLKDEEKALNDLIQVLLKKRKVESDLEQVERQKQLKEDQRRALEKKQDERRKIFEEVNKEKREKYKQIHQYLQQQEKKLKELETARTEKQIEITQLKKETTDFQQKQKDLYKEKSDFEIQNIIQTRNLDGPADLRANSLRPNNIRPQSQQSFLSRNLGSAISPNPHSAINDQQSAIFEQVTLQNQQPQPVQCKVQQSFFDELRQKLLPIFMLVSLIVMVWKL